MNPKEAINLLTTNGFHSVYTPERNRIRGYLKDKHLRIDPFDILFDEEEKLWVCCFEAGLSAIFIKVSQSLEVMVKAICDFYKLHQEYNDYINSIVGAFFFLQTSGFITEIETATDIAIYPVSKETMNKFDHFELMLKGLGLRNEEEKITLRFYAHKWIVLSDSINPDKDLTFDNILNATHFIASF